LDQCSRHEVDEVHVLYFDQQGGTPLTDDECARMMVAFRGLAGESLASMRAQMREALTTAGPDVVAELFGKLDEIEGPDGKRPIVTVECFTDGTKKLSVDIVRLGQIRTTVSSEAWRLMRDTCIPGAIWATMHGASPLHRLFDS
jgi:hypothetical protein